MLSVYAQLCQFLCDPTDCSPPGSAVHGIFQAKILEWLWYCINVLFKVLYYKIKNIFFIFCALFVCLLCIISVESIINLLNYSTI